MKKKTLLLALVTAMLVMCAFVVPASAATKVKLNSKSLSIKVGEQVLLELKNASRDVEWKANKKIVELKTDGNSVTIIGAKAGTTNVKAVYKGKTYKCKVTVENYTPIMIGIDYTIKIYEYSKQKYINIEGRYVGDLKDGVPNGKGRFYNQGAYVILGSFKNGKMNGLMEIDYLDGRYEEYECKNGKFIKSVCYDTDDNKTEYILKDDILYYIYNGKSITHYSVGNIENYNLIDWLYEVDYSNQYSGYNMSKDSAISIDTIRRLSNSKIKDKAKYIEPKKLKKNLTPYIDCVDCLKKAYVIQCEEFSPHKSWGIDTITFMLLSYDGYVYAIWYEGSIDVYEGDNVNCWFTPFSNVSYTNISNTTTLATCGVAYIVKPTKYAV